MLSKCGEVETSGFVCRRTDIQTNMLIRKLELDGQCDRQATIVDGLLTTLVTTVAKFLQVQSLGQDSGGKYPLFWRYPNFLRS